MIIGYACMCVLWYTDSHIWTESVGNGRMNKLKRV